MRRGVVMMTDDYPPQSKMTVDQYVDSLYAQYGPEAIVSSDISVRPDRFDEKTDFVDAMQDESERLRNHRHCEDVILGFDENTHTHLQYLRCTFHVAVTDDAPNGWLAEEMREIIDGVRGDE